MLSPSFYNCTPLFHPRSLRWSLFPGLPLFFFQYILIVLRSEWSTKVVLNVPQSTSSLCLHRQKVRFESPLPPGLGKWFQNWPSTDPSWALCWQQPCRVPIGHHFSAHSLLLPNPLLQVEHCCQGAVALSRTRSRWDRLSGLPKPLKGNEPWPPFYGLHYDLASKCEKRFQDSLCAVESLNCTFKHSVIFVINIIVSEGREARTVLITNRRLQSGGISKASLILRWNTVLWRISKILCGLCSESSLAFDNMKKFYNMWQIFYVKVLPDNWEICIKTFIRALPLLNE